MKQIVTFFSEVKDELAKVVWPKKDEVIQLTAVVFLVSGLVGAFVGGLDFIFTKALELIVAK